jgi:hypothetical protein
MPKFAVGISAKQCIYNCVYIDAISEEDARIQVIEKINELSSRDSNERELYYWVEDVGDSWDASFQHLQDLEVTYVEEYGDDDEEV